MGQLVLSSASRKCDACCNLQVLCFMCYFWYFGVLFFQYYNLILKTITVILSNDLVFNLVIIFHFISPLSVENVLKNSFIGCVVSQNVCFSLSLFLLS